MQVPTLGYLANGARESAVDHAVPRDVEPRTHAGVMATPADWRGVDGADVQVVTPEQAQQPADHGSTLPLGLHCPAG
jgi:hypothetical protein